jgi:hypothetical protein
LCQKKRVLLKIFGLNMEKVLKAFFNIALGLFIINSGMKTADVLENTCFNYGSSIGWVRDLSVIAGISLPIAISAVLNLKHYRNW